MMTKKDNNEIWYWYQKIEEFKATGMMPTKYCNDHEINLRKFLYMYSMIEYIRESNPERYKNLMPLAKECMDTTISIAKFSKKHNISKRDLGDMVRHLRCLDTIAKLQKTKGKESEVVNFIKVPQPVRSESAISAEVVESQNELEIIIAKGVKVIISPNIDSMKIIKIIELLKDL